MAAVIGEFVSNPVSRFHGMIASAGLTQQHQDAHKARYRSGSRGSDIQAAASHSSASSSTEPCSSPFSPSSEQKRDPVGGGASQFPTPPNSSSPKHPSATSRLQNANDGGDSMATQTCETASAGSRTVIGPNAPLASPRPQQPSPAPDGQAEASADHPNYAADASSPRQEAEGQTVHVRDLSHIQSLVRADLLRGNGTGTLNDGSSNHVKYEISAMPIGDIIEMVAALLTKITSTNDLQHDALQRNVVHQRQASQSSESNNSSPMSSLSTSVLAFHGKNVPAITILSYLSRIHKYCPTTYDVFLSLLVYFDRMTERVNEMVVKAEEARQKATSASSAAPPTSTASDQPATPANDVDMDESDESEETDSDLADDDDEVGSQASKKVERQEGQTERHATAAEPDPSPSAGPATYFVVDSFNIHRLVIAGVTCASKFFSDVFYTNSRYAKVGGLPLPELNHLEVEFLDLNDFRLAVPVEDLEAYATMLVEFYAREVVTPQLRPAHDD